MFAPTAIARPTLMRAWSVGTSHPRVAVFLLAFIARAAFVAVTKPNPFHGVDDVEYFGMAQGLLSGQGFVDLVGFVRPPLYPVFLALTYALGGIPLLQVAQIALGAATAVVVGMLASTLHRRPEVAPIAGTVAALYPWFFQWVGTIASETLFTLLAVVAFLAIARASRSARAWPAIVAGIVFGLASLTRANILVLAPFIAVWWWRLRGFAAPFLFGMAVVGTLLPFTLYNLAAGNGLVLASSGGGMNFYIGNNPDTTRMYSGELSDDEWRELSAHSDLGTAAFVTAGCDPTGTLLDCYASVPRSDREAFFYRAAFRYISAHPVDWVLTDLHKLVHYWRPWVEPRVYPLGIVLVSGLSFAALLVFALLGLRSMPSWSAWLVVAIAMGTTLAAVIWGVQLRYRFALLDPMLIAAAAAPLRSLLGGATRRIGIPRGP